MYIKNYVYVVTGMDCMEWEKVYTFGVFTSKTKAEMAKTELILKYEEEERDMFFSIEVFEINKIKAL